MTITEDIKYVGVNDHDIDLFEGQYQVENGMAYNSYVITDDKIAIFDTVDAHFSEEWLANIKNVLGDAKPDYLIIQHMEPDHSASIGIFMENYPDTTIVASAKAFTIMKQFFGCDYAEHQLVVKEKDTLELGKHTLTFVAAPMVHWPEVIMTYDSYAKVFFSADAFGKFGALDVEEDWACEARRYYFGIVGKYGAQVQALLKKAATLDIKMICPLHGPILKENLAFYIDKYNTWSSYEPEDEGVFVAYASIHGNTAEAAKEFVEMLRKNGAEKVVIADLSREDMAEAVEDAFRYSKLVVAAASYDAGVFPCMEDFLHHLKAKNYQKRTVGIIENGSWAPSAAKQMKAILEGMKNITICEPVVTIKSTLNETSRKAMEELAKELA